MSTVAEIKRAIEKLSPQERCELEALLHPWPDDDWDRQMQADAEPGGKLHEMMSASRKDAEARQAHGFREPGPAAPRMRGKEGVTIDQLLSSAAPEKLGAVLTLEHLRERAVRAKREDFAAFLDASPDVPPIPGDEL